MMKRRLTPDIDISSPSRQIKAPKTRAGRTTRDIQQVKAAKIQSLNMKMTDDKMTCSINGMTLTRNNVLLLADFDNNKLKAVSPEGKILSSLTLSGSPIGIAVMDDTTAAFSTNGKQLHILDISDPGSLAIQRSVSLGYGAGSVAACNNNLVVVTWSEPRCVKMITLTGTELWSVFAEHNDQRPFNNLRSVTTNIVNDKQTVIVIDMVRETITLLDSDNGDVIKTVDIKGKDPRGITVDNDGNVYVCCRTPREVCVWSADFSQSRILLSSSDLQEKVRDILYCDNTDEIFISYSGMDTVDRFQLS